MKLLCSGHACLFWSVHLLSYNQVNQFFVVVKNVIFTITLYDRVKSGVINKLQDISIRDKNIW